MLTIFLYQDQLSSKYSCPKSDTVDQFFLNFVLNPIKNHDDPINDVITDSIIDGKLDSLFSYDALGIKEETSTYDEAKISEFTENISFDGTHYAVDLPWHENVKNVQSNFEISKMILGKVVEKLKSQDLYDSYEKIIEQQANRRKKFNIF